MFDIIGDKGDNSKSITILQYADDLAIFSKSEEQNLICYKFTVKRRNYMLPSVRVRLLYSMLIRAKHHLYIYI